MGGYPFQKFTRKSKPRNTVEATKMPETRVKRKVWQAFIILIIGLIITLIATLSAKSQLDEVGKQEFTADSNKLRQKIQDRFSAQEAILLTSAGFFNTIDTVTREDWHIFIRNINVDYYFPGTQAFGFAEFIPPAELPGHIAKIRAQGFPEYTIRPEGVRETYTSIIYIEPFTGRNLKAFGYDMFSEPVRRAAMERARDENAPALSGKVTLVQETALEKAQAGMLLYIPVYKRGMPIETTEQRRSALAGWVYNPYRMGDLMNSIIGDLDLQTGSNLHLQVFDGEDITPETLLYDSLAYAGLDRSNQKEAHLEIPIEIAGRRLTLLFTRAQGLKPLTGYTRVWIIGVFGTIVSVLLFALFLSQGNIRFRAEQIARGLTSELFASEAQLQSVIRAIQDYAIIQLDLSGRVVSWNPAVERIQGYTADEIIGEHFSRFYADDDVKQGKPEHALHIAAAEGKYEEEGQRVRKDGTRFAANVIITPLRNLAGELTGYVEVTRDITERKRAEIDIHNKSEQLRLLSSELEIIIDTIPGLVFYKDTNNRFIRVNKYMSDTYKKSKNQLEGANLFDLHSREQAQAYFEDDLQVIRSRQPKLNISEPLETENGTRWVNTSKIPYINETGEVVGVIGVSMDVTEIKQAEADRTARQVAERANQSKSEFLSRMSHELRTPLNSILGFAQLLEMEELAPGVAKSVKQILTSGRYLLDMINEVLDIARIDAGRLSISPEPVELHSLILETLDTVAPMADARHLTMALANGQDNNLFVRADRQRLKQVLLNLINNAIKYNRDGGSVTVAVKLMDEPVVEIANSEERPSSSSRLSKKVGANQLEFVFPRAMVRISITDIGIGIPAEQVSKLFNPFERGSAGQTELEGTGLGLAVSKKLVEAMEGTINFESTPGLGSTFWVDLPQAASTLSSSLVVSALKKLPPDHSVSGLVLYVEDNQSNLQLVEQIFIKRPGVKLITALNGQLALELTQSQIPDLILLDLNLPGLSGAEVLSLLRADPKTQHIPVVVLSADATPERIEILKKAGIQGYITKPLDVVQFIKLVDEMLAGINQKEKN